MNIVSRLHPPFPRSYVRRGRSGFTLTEIAIVLGVISVIVLGISSAASAVLDRSRLQQGTDELTIIINNMRSLLASSNSSAVALNSAKVAAAKGTLKPKPSGADFCYYTPLFTSGKSGVFPEGMLTPIGGGANTASHPWNHTPQCDGTVGSAMIGFACTSGVGGCDMAQTALIVARYNNIPSAGDCVRLVVTNSLSGVGSGLSRVEVNGVVVGSAAAKTLPVSVANAGLAGACFGPGPFIIDWYYKISF